MSTDLGAATSTAAPTAPPPARRSRLKRASATVTHGLETLPLRVRLVAVVVILLLLALTVTAGATAYLMRRDLTARTDADLRTAAKGLAEDAADLIRTDRESGLPTGYAVVFQTLLGAEQAIYPTSESLRPDIPDLSPNDGRVTSHQPFTIGSTAGTLRWRAISGQVLNRNGQVIGTYVVAVSQGPAARTVSRLILTELLIGLGAVLLCALAGWFGVRRAFRPLTRIEDTAAAIARGDLSRRIPTRAAKDEVTSLSRSLNVMLAQIERSFAVREASEERMRQFVADASHELRTPLAAVRGYAELYRQGAVREPEDVAGAMGRIESEATRMGGLVEDLLMLARLDTQRPLDEATVDLTVLASDAVQDAQAIDSSRPVRLVGLGGNPLQPTEIQGDDAKLRQVLANLVGNAVSHTPAGTPMEVAVGHTPDGGHAVVEIRDHGPGVNPEQAQRVFERFFRADPSRTRATGRGGGNGLGLAIVAAIVGQHRGKVGVAQTPGGGATFVVELPTGNSQGTSSLV